MPRRLIARAVLAGLALGGLPAALAGCGGDTAAAPAAAVRAPVSRAEFGRNVVRVPGRSSADVAAAAVLATLHRDRPAGWMLVRRGAWAEAAVAAQFAAGPAGAALLPTEADHVPAPAADVTQRVELAGFRQTPRLQGLVLGDVERHLFAHAQELDLPNLSRLRARSPAALSAAAVPFAGGFSGRYSKSVVILSSRAPEYALPAAAWSAFSGDTVAFVDGARVPEETVKLLRQRQKLTLVPPSIYLAGPAAAIPEAAARELARHGRVQRIPGETPVELAVELARFHDDETGFGWGAVEGPSSVVLMNQDHPDDVIAALALAARGPRAPLLLVDRADRLPVPVLAYLRQLRGRVPSQAFALGDRERFSTELLAQLDALLEAGGAGAR